jgi:hypothetical protein
LNNVLFVIAGIEIQMNTGLKSYTTDELKFLPYKHDIDTLYNRIIEHAKSGYQSVTIEVNPARNRIIIKHLQELFPDTLFTHTKVSDSKEAYGYIIYKVSWSKKKAYTEVYPFNISRRMRVRF